MAAATLAFGILLAACASLDRAQQVQVQLDPDAPIPDEATCAACSIELGSPLVLRQTGAGTIPYWPETVHEDGLGRIWLIFVNDLPLIFDRSGAFVAELGPQGVGPNEYDFPAAAQPLPGDSMLVWDRGRRGQSVFYVVGPGLDQARTIRMPLQVGAVSISVARWPDSVLVSPGDGVRDARFAAFNLFSFSGTVAEPLTSFSDAHPLAGPAATSGPVPPPTQYHGLGSSQSFGAWAWQTNRYAIERWSYAGVFGGVLQRQAPWFEPYDRPLVASPMPSPILRTVQQDGTGKLWVFVDVARPDWRRAHQVSAPGSNDPRGTSESNNGSGTHLPYEMLYRTTVEVIDPSTHRVLARSTLDDWIVGVLPGQRAVIYGTTEIGEPYVHVRQLELKR